MILIIMSPWPRPGLRKRPALVSREGHAVTDIYIYIYDNNDST